MIDIIVTSCYLSFVSSFLVSWQVLKTFGGSQHRLTDTQVQIRVLRTTIVHSSCSPESFQAKILVSSPQELFDNYLNTPTHHHRHRQQQPNKK